MYDPIYAMIQVKAGAAKHRRILAEIRYDDIMANGYFGGSYEESKPIMDKANKLEKEWKSAVAAELEIKFSQINYAYKNWRAE